MKSTVSNILIIDGQILQTGAWYRGMGRYTINLLREINSQAIGYDSIEIVFNTNLKVDDRRFEEVSALWPNIKQNHLTLPTPEKGGGRGDAYKKELQKFIEQKFPHSNIHYFITSLFTFDYFAIYPDGVQKLLLFYDLIPLMYWDELGGYFPPHLYMTRFTQIYEADIVFTISGTVRNDVIATFGLPESKVVSINGGYTPVVDVTKKPPFSIPDNYILFPSGDLPHKNNELAIKGFAEFSKHSKTRYHLLITSTFSKKSIKRLSAISELVMFTGNVTDEELRWLYQNAKGILFASKYEGLGIPILDAVACGKPVVASRIPVFQEMSKDAFYYFKPHDSKSLAGALSDFETGKGLKEKIRSYQAILTNYSWERTAELFLDALDSLDTRYESIQELKEKKRIAIVGVNPGVNDQLGNLAEPIHNILSADWEADCYFDDLGREAHEIDRPTYLSYIGVKVFNISRMTPRAYRSYDLVIYLMDELSFPSVVAQTAIVLPGVVIGYFAELDSIYKNWQQTVCDNQKSVVLLADKPKDWRDMADSLIRCIKDAEGVQLEQERILRSGMLNRSIKKRLEEYVSSK